MSIRSIVIAGALLLVAPTGGRAAADTRAPVTTIALEPARPARDGFFHGPVKVVLRARDGSGVATTQYRIDRGPWRTYQAPARAIFDGTPASFLRWRQAGSGGFVLQPDGTITSVGGLGMLWYPVEAFGDVAITLQWRDIRPDECCSNSGVFVRFPNPEDAIVPPTEQRHACQSGNVGNPSMTPARVLAEWVAIYCGHEIQINDGTTDPQKTGSVYNFSSLGIEQAKPNTRGDWNDFEIRTTGGGSYTIEVIRNGALLNRFVNAPGKTSARAGDPPTDQRRFERGHIGVQNHLAGDSVQFRNITVRDLRPEAAAFTVSAPGKHTIWFRSIDFAGNVERAKSATVRIKAHHH